MRRDPFASRRVAMPGAWRRTRARFELAAELGAAGHALGGALEPFGMMAALGLFLTPGAAADLEEVLATVSANAARLVRMALDPASVAE